MLLSLIASLALAVNPGYTMECVLPNGCPVPQRGPLPTLCDGLFTYPCDSDACVGLLELAYNWWQSRENNLPSCPLGMVRNQACMYGHGEGLAECMCAVLEAKMAQCCECQTAECRTAIYNALYGNFFDCFSDFEANARRCCEVPQ